MTHVSYLRIMMEDVIILNRLHGSQSKFDVPRLIELLNKSDLEIASILANPKEDISWYEPFAGHMQDPELYALIKEIMSV